MLKTIATVSPELTAFVETLKLPLNVAQHRHITQIADGLITTQGSKTLSALYRHIVGDPCPKSAADTFRPWQADDIHFPLPIGRAALRCQTGSKYRALFRLLSPKLAKPQIYYDPWVHSPAGGAMVSLKPSRSCPRTMTIGWS